MTRGGKWDGLQGKVNEAFTKISNMAANGENQSPLGKAVRESIFSLKNLCLFAFDALEAEINTLKEENEVYKSCQADMIRKCQTDLEELKGARKELGKDALQELMDLKTENGNLKKEIAALQETQGMHAKEVQEMVGSQQKLQQQIMVDQQENSKWIEVVKKQKTSPAKNETVTAALEENKKRQQKALNIRVTGLPKGQSPREDAISLAKKIGALETSFSDAWRVGKDPNRDQPLIISFADTEQRLLFLRRRAALRGSQTYMGDDLTPLQVEQRKEGMLKVMEARRAGKWAVYRDDRVIITDKRPT